MLCGGALLGTMEAEWVDSSGQRKQTPEMVSFIQETSPEFCVSCMDQALLVQCGVRSGSSRPCPGAGSRGREVPY